MKRFEFLAVFLFFLLLFSKNDLFSQKIIESKNPFLNDVFKEKLKIDIDKFFEELKNPQSENIQHKRLNDEKDFISGTTRESVVSADSYPESELSAAINPKDSDNIIVAVIKQTAVQTNPLLVPVYYTNDFGKTWNISNFAALPPRSDLYVAGGGDPVIVFDNNGVAHLTWISLSFKLNESKTKIDSIFTAMHYGYSTDGGVTWKTDYYKSVSQSANSSPGYLDISRLKYFDDKQWLAVDLDKNSPRENNVYICFSRFETSSSTGAKIVSCTKNSSDNTFSPNIYTVTKGILSNTAAHQFSSNSVAKNGRLLVTSYRKRSVDEIISSYSDDGGVTFSEPKQISPFSFVNSRLISSPNQDSIVGVDISRVYPCIYNASDNNPDSKYYGNSYVTWSSYGLSTKSTTKFNVYFAISTDAGESWGTPVEISHEPLNGPEDQFYPAITVNKNGVIIISWYEQGVGGVTNNTNYVVAFSFDGGKTFTKPVAANTVPTDFSTIGKRNSKFGIGEYNQVLATNNYAIPVWSDGRSGNGNLNLYAAFIPINPEVNSIDKIISLSVNPLTLTISPNPANDMIQVKLYNAKVSLTNYTIFDLMGNIIHESSTNSDNFSIDLSGFKSGAYFIEAVNNGVRTVFKFQKN